MIEFIKKIFKKYREQITYLIFGGLTTLVSIAVSSLFYYVIFGKTHNILSNVISEIVAITFAYITNKLFVFCSKTNDFKSLLKEILIIEIGDFSPSFFLGFWYNQNTNLVQQCHCIDVPFFNACVNYFLALN